MTQKARILRALRNGPTNSADFMVPTCDGGTPIMRVAARIYDLRDEGYGITSRRMMNGTETYTLTSEPAEAAAATRPPGAGLDIEPSSLPAAPSLLTGEQLFDLAVPEKKPRHALEPFEDAA